MTLRLYGGGRAQRRAVVVTLAAPSTARTRVDFVVRSRNEVVRGGVDPGGARSPIRLGICVPARGHVDATVVTDGNARLDGRSVALHVDRLAVVGAGPCGRG